MMIQHITEVMYGFAGEYPKELKREMREKREDMMTETMKKIGIDSDKIRNIAKERIKKDKNFYIEKGPSLAK